MSTRTNIKIMSNGEVIATLYRHMDGYPAETGADLLEKVKAQKHASNTARALLAETYEMQAYDKQPRHIYIIGETAGDIEHWYCIHFNHNQPPTISHAERPDWKTDLDNWIITAKSYTLEQFAEVVNKDRRAINQRIEQLKREQPIPYKDTDFYPMVEA